MTQRGPRRDHRSTLGEHGAPVGEVEDSVQEHDGALTLVDDACDRPRRLAAGRRRWTLPKENAYDPYWSMLTIRDAPFRVPPRPPYPWGASPFRGRGILYRDQLAHVNRALAPLGTTVAELVGRTGDSALEAFLSQPFDSLTWYDMQPGVWTVEILANHRGITPANQIHEIVVALVDGSLRGFSGVLLKVLSNEAVATWLPRMSTWFHDFGTLETHVVDRGHVRGVRHGLPSFFVHFWAEAATCFIERVLERVGAKDPRAYALNVEPDGVHGSVALYRVPFEVRWTPS